MDHPVLAFDDLMLASAVPPLARQQQRIVHESLLQRLELRRRVLMRQRVRFVVACVIALAGIIIALLGGRTPPSSFVFALGMVTYAVSGLFLTVTAIQGRGEDNLAEVLDLMEQNRAAIKLLDAAEAETGGR